MDDISDSIKESNACVYFIDLQLKNNLTETNEENKDHGSQYSSPVSGQSLTSGQSSHLQKKEKLPCVGNAFDQRGEASRTVQEALSVKQTLYT